MRGLTFTCIVLVAACGDKKPTTTTAPLPLDAALPDDGPPPTPLDISGLTQVPACSS
jgi:hypothetical protein